MRKSILFLLVVTFIMMLSSCGAVCDVIMYNEYDYPIYEYRAPYRPYRPIYYPRTVYVVPRTIYIPRYNRPRWNYNNRSFGKGIRQRGTFGNGRFGGRR